MGLDVEFVAEKPTLRFSNLKECLAALPEYRYRAVSPGELSFRIGRSSQPVFDAQGRLISHRIYSYLLEVSGGCE